MRKQLILFLIILALPTVVAAATPNDQTGFTPKFDVDVWIDELEYYVLSVDLDTGDTIYVEIEVTSGAGIDFFICDQENYDLWTSLQSASVYRQQHGVGSISTSFTAPAAGKWYCVFFNDALLTSKHIEGYVGTSPLFALGGDILLGVVGLVIAIIIGGVIWFVLKKTQKSTPSSAQPHLQQPYPPPSGPVGSTSNYCPYCGTPKQSTDSKFCAKCGRAFDGPSLG
ncbi:MAG: hypothetical protein ACFFEK_16195 [Candidatus Thorarchaeota archaeon]